MKAGSMKQSFIHRILNRSFALGISVLFISLFGPFTPGVFSQESEPVTTGEERIHITSDRMISRQAEQLVEFSGEVRATQGNTVINADLLRIHFKDGESFPAGDDGNDAIEKLVAVGNVVIDHENRKAYSEEAVYTSSDGLLILSGEKVVVKEDGSSITGQRVVLNRDTGEIVITGETGRVEAFFEQNGESRIRSGEKNSSGGK